MGKSKPATQNTVQTSTPWGPTGELTNQILQGAQAAYGATPKTVAGTYAPQNAIQTQAIQSAVDAAGTADYGATQLRGLADSWLAPGATDPTKNATLQAAIQASIQPLQKQLHQNVTSIGDAAQMAGAYGGSRQGVVEGTALGQFNDTAANTAAGMNYQFFNDATNRQAQAGGIYELASKLGLAPSQILEAAGASQQGQDQAALSAAAQAPWNGLDNLTSIFGAFSPYGTQNQNIEKTGAKSSAAVGGIKGAAGGAQLGSAFGPWGTAAGAVIGGLGGLFG